MIDSVLIVLGGLGAGLGIDEGADIYARREADRAGVPAAPPPRWATGLTVLGSGAVSAAAVVWAPASLLVFTVLLGWLLLALAAIDLRTYLLPDALNAGVLILGAAMVWMTRPEAWALHLVGAGAGYGVMWTVEQAYKRLRGFDGLGRGDAKLLGALGMWVGALGLPAALLIASLCGIAAALGMAAMRGTLVSGQSMIAFGPFIALGGFGVWLLQMAGVLAPGLG